MNPRRFRGSLASCIFTIVVATMASAETKTVTSNLDDGSAGTLRELIKNAASGDVIVIPESVGTITLTAAGATALDTDGSADLDVTKRISIAGAASDKVVIDADGATTAARAFEIDTDDSGAALTLTGVTVRNGKPSGAGGGILVSNYGQLTIRSCVVSGNEADGGSYGGGIGVIGSGFLVMSQTTISGNRASRGAGIYLDWSSYGASALIADSVVSGNTATSDGGGIYSYYQPLEVVNSKVKDNMANDGGGIYSDYAPLTIHESEITGNTANGSGGGIYSEGTTLVDRTLVDGNRVVGGGEGAGIYNSEYLLYVTNSTISNNVSDGEGGGIHNEDDTVLVNSVVRGNSAADAGGGFYQYYQAVIDNVTIDGNTVQDGYAGGLYIEDATVVRNTVISNNKAKGDNGYGGGVENDYNVDFINVTIAGNEADADGGGIANYEIANLNNVTITGNKADADGTGASGDGGGIYNDYFVTVNNSIIAGNADGSAGAEAPECYNDFSSGHQFSIGGPTILTQDVSDAGQCEVTGQVALVKNVSPKFDAAGLADNDGMSQGRDGSVMGKTVALASDSPALNAGDANCFLTDARGLSRPQGGACDLGAWEAFVAPATPVPMGVPFGAEEEDDGGCSASHPGMALFWLLGLLGIAAFRRRSA